VGLLENAPHSMALYNALARHVFARSYDRVRGTNAIGCLAELEASQWWSHEKLEETRSQRLQRLVTYTYQKVPYYRRLMAERGLRPADIAVPSDLPRLPVLTKDLIRENTSDLLAAGFPRTELLRGQTGGSSGTPLCFYASREGQLTHGHARSLRAMEWAHVFLGDRTVIVTKRGSGASARRWLTHAVSRAVSRDVFIDSSGFSDTTLPDVVDRIGAIRPQALRGYASAVCIIADFIQETGMQTPEVGEVVVGGEQLFDEQRSLLNNVFGRQPFSRYSSFENFDIAMECDAHKGMHINAEDLIVEIVDDDGNPVPPGTRGRLLVTNLHEYGMPLLRYDTDDESSFTGADCPCGRRLPLIDAVIGKTGNVIRTLSGKRLSPLTLGASNLAPMGVRRFQFVQESLDRVVVRIVPEPRLRADEVAALPSRVKDTFGRVLGDDVHIDVVVVDQIQPTPAGKHLFLISKVGSDSQ
jgi:phenylacetate-CoA ligase